MKPVLFAIAFLTAALGTYVALDVFDIGPRAVSDCCAAEG
jgi:hypothetical protein